MIIDQFHKFILLFVGTLAAFHLLPRRFAWVPLLIGSYWLFISLDPHYWWLLAALSGGVYLWGLLLGALPNGRLRWAAFTLGVVLAFAPLLRFKYGGFSSDSGLRSVILPLGISFYSFQAVSYLYDIYKARIAPCRHPGLVFLYIAFFPHLLAGPIVKAEDLIPQLALPERPTEEDRASAWRLIFFGVFKKFALANNLALFSTTAFAWPEKYRGLPILFALLCFRYQLYFDFSGYTDIARGTGRLFGVSLPENFKNPFAATSVGDYWRRWHITLVSWFRDHVFFPLCRAKPTEGWIRFASILTMLLVGLWHSAGWAWVVFGLINGVLIVLDSATAPARRRLGARLGLDRWPRARKGFAIVTTFTLTSIPGLATLSGGLHEFAQNARGLLPQPGYLNGAAFESFTRSVLPAEVFVAVVALTVGVELLNYRISTGLGATWQRVPFAARYALYAAVGLLFVIFADMDKLSFFYFQF